MEILSVNPIHLEQETEITKTTIIQDNEEYLIIKFHDDLDDALTEPQIIRIHPVDIPDFVEMLNRTVNLL
jgi:hypothetical protein